MLINNGVSSNDVSIFKASTYKSLHLILLFAPNDQKWMNFLMKRRYGMEWIISLNSQRNLWNSKTQAFSTTRLKRKMKSRRKKGHHNPWPLQRRLRVGLWLFLLLFFFSPWTHWTSRRSMMVNYHLLEGQC